MAKKTFSIIMDTDLLEKLEAVALKNRRKRSAEISTAIEFYLNHIDDIDELVKQRQVKLEEEAKDVKTSEAPTATNEAFYNSSLDLDEVPSLGGN